MPLIHVLGESGSVMYFDRDVLPEAIAGRLEKGDLVRVNADGSPWVDSTPEIADDPPPDAPHLPSVRENRAAWMAFAISQGMEREKAALLTKAQLIEEFTRLRSVS